MAVCASINRSSWRAVITTCAPSSASVFAVSNPIPLLAPVMTATLPFNPKSIKIAPLSFKILLI